MGKPAARIGDMHVCPMFDGKSPHVGGPVAVGEPTVLIGGVPAARVGDICTCIGGPPDPIAMGSASVMIGGKPAARMGDSTAHGGKIVVGLPTVLIGDAGAGLVIVAVSPVLAQIQAMATAAKNGTPFCEKCAAGAAMAQLSGATSTPSASASAPAPPPSTPPPPTGTITSQTTATSPANLQRTKIGVGEEVTLTYQPGAATWTIISGSGSLSGDSGSTIKFTAADSAGSVTITAAGSGGSSSITFTVVIPDSWNMKRRSGTNVKHTLNTLDNGWQGIPFLHPNDVNFYRVEVREKDSQAVGTGSLSSATGLWHSNGAYPPPARVGEWTPIVNHSVSDGSSTVLWDDIYVKLPPAGSFTHPPFIAGTATMPITWQWHVVAGANITDLPGTTQDHSISTAGVIKSTKAGHTEQSLYSDPTSTP